VGWQVLHHNGGYKIADVIIDGGSEEIAYRQAFTDIVESQGGGVQAVIHELRQKEQQLSDHA